MLSPRDRRILAELQRDSRLTTQELADRVGMSSSATWRRVRSLEEAGIIDRARQAKEAEDRRNAEELAQRLAAMKPLLFTKKVGEEDSLYGSVTVAEIAEALLMAVAAL